MQVTLGDEGSWIADFRREKRGVARDRERDRDRGVVLILVVDRRKRINGGGNLSGRPGLDMGLEDECSDDSLFMAV